MAESLAKFFSTLEDVLMKQNANSEKDLPHKVVIGFSL